MSTPKKHVKVPTKEVGGEIWGDLSVFGKDHDICGTTVKQNRDISFMNQHKVRLYTFKQMVHWRIPAGTELDITEVGLDRRRVMHR